jgi:hypothetical protein
LELALVYRKKNPRFFCYYLSFFVMLSEYP